jgi:hypothetical protein
MPLLRLAYTTLFLIALLAVFELWSQVGGQSHLDLMPWYLKLILGAGAAFTVVKAAAAAVAGERAWNRQTLRWAGILLALLIGCGLASYYAHLYLEEDEQEEQNVSGCDQRVPALTAANRSRTRKRAIAVAAPKTPKRKARRVLMPAGPRRSDLTLYL